MLLPKILDPFIARSPVSVMVRGTLQRLFDGESLQVVFDDHAQRQYTRKLTFFHCIRVMSDVVFKTVPSVSAWYETYGQELAATRQALYEKLNHMEPGVSGALVRHSAEVLMPVVREMKHLPAALLPGYRVRVLDGNHLTGTEHRLVELRRLRAATLPGQSLALYDPQFDLVTDVVCCEDAYAQERTMLPEILRRIVPGDCLVADRNFCTTGFLAAIDVLPAFFVIRQHATLKPKALGERRRAGKDEHGRMLYEQWVEVSEARTGRTLKLRRITIQLKKPTKDGEMEIHLLTNLPEKDADAVKVASLYADRWTIEHAFEHLTEDLRCEIDTLAYPRAALFGFCVAVMAYNAVSAVKSATRAAWGEEFVEEELSMFYLTLEVARVNEGMEIAVEERHWEIFARMNDEEFGQTLMDLAGRMRLSQYRKHKRGPKRPPPKKISGRERHHVSTFRLLAQRK